MKLLENIKIKPWQSPWILMLVSIYAFCLLWIYFAIIHRYHIKKDYNSALPGLDKTPARKFFMVGHMTLGAVCLLLGPTQFLPCIRRKYKLFHRVCGRLYVVSAIVCSLFGLVFICLKKFQLVGGYNMGVAFSIAGMTFGICAFMTGYYGYKRNYTKHRNWSIRAYSQILSPMLYRYFYLIVGGLGLYKYSGSECNDNDVCTPFTNTFDAIHAWTYFIVPFIFAECIVRSLPQEGMVHVMSGIDVHEGQQDIEITIDDKDDLEVSSTIPFNYTRLNLLGIIGAITSIGATVLIYVTSYAGTNTAAY